MKKLICAEDVEKLAKKGQKALCVVPGTILTPSAKDAVQAAGMEICEATPGCVDAPCEKVAGEAASCEETSGEVTSCEATSDEKAPCGETCGDDEISGELVYTALKAVLGK